jgi:hypothetical protein
VHREVLRYMRRRDGATLRVPRVHVAYVRGVQEIRYTYREAMDIHRPGARLTYRASVLIADDLLGASRLDRVRALA